MTDDRLLMTDEWQRPAMKQHDHIAACLLFGAALAAVGVVWTRTGGPPAYRPPALSNDAYDPGRFVTFLGFEWTNWVSGHRNVYYRDGDGDPP